jgi:hypothetical protein
MKISISEVIQELDETIIEKMIWDDEDKVKLSRFRLKWRVLKSLDKRVYWYKRMLKTASMILLISILLPITTKAAIDFVLTQSALIDDTNMDLIGKEIIDYHYIVYKDGSYMNEKGEVINLEKMRSASESIPDNRIIKKIQIEHYTPSSIVEVTLKGTHDDSYSTPEIIMVNNSVCILTKEGGTGWFLKKGDTFEYSFEKYKSDVVEQQSLVIGYVKDGVMYQGEDNRNLTGNYTLEAHENGEYYIYLLSVSSDYLALKKGELNQNSNK